MKGFGDNKRSKENFSNKQDFKPIKENLIKLAFKYHLKGEKFNEAKCYEYFIKQGYSDYRVFNNYGAILKSFRKYKEAELYTRKALELKPDLSEAIINIGQLYVDREQYELALEQFDLLDTWDSRARGLECLYELDRIDEIYERIESKDDGILNKGIIHVDSEGALCAGLIYLNKDAPKDTGTSFYKLKDDSYIIRQKEDIQKILDGGEVERCKIIYP